jgi:hypothetical protein
MIFDRDKYSLALPDLRQHAAAAPAEVVCKKDLGLQLLTTTARRIEELILDVKATDLGASKLFSQAGEDDVTHHLTVVFHADQKVKASHGSSSRQLWC